MAARICRVLALNRSSVRPRHSAKERSLADDDARVGDSRLVPRSDEISARVALCVANLDDPALDALDLAALVSDDERARAARVVSKRIGVRRLRARVALRCALGAHLGRDPRTLVFAYGEAGKPALVDDATPFNATDSGALWALAIGGDAPLGLDVEEARDEVDIDGVGERVFVARERAAIATLAPDARRGAFFRLWTLKESYMKAVGLGFRMEPTSFEFRGFCCDGEAPTLVASEARPRDIGNTSSALIHGRFGLEGLDGLHAAPLALTRLSTRPLHLEPVTFDLRAAAAAIGGR